MHTGPTSDNRGYSAQHQSSIRISLPGGTIGPPTYAQSHHSGRYNNTSLKKEAVHLPYKTASPDFADLPANNNHSNHGVELVQKIVLEILCKDTDVLLP